MWNYQNKNNPYHLYKVHYSDKDYTRVIRDDMQEDTIPTVIFNQDYFLCEYTYDDWKAILVEVLRKHVATDDKKYLNLVQHACAKWGNYQLPLLYVISRGDHWKLKNSRMLSRSYPISERVKDLLNKI